MAIIVTSDVHLGSPYCRCDEFIRFVEGLRGGDTLVLNGDTVNSHEASRYPARHREALELIREVSRQRKVVWIRGNHDERYVMDAPPGGMEFTSSYSVGKDLFIGHGHDFDNVMPHNRAFIVLFRSFHWLRIRLGAESIHVALYAKRFPFLYRVLLRHVSLNAVEHARENGYRAAVCGHTDYVEDRDVGGIRYLNTGAWTERSVHCLRVDGGSVELEQVF